YKVIGGYRHQQRMRANGEHVDPADLRQLRTFFSRYHSHGTVVGTWNCGIVSGMSNLWEHEGMEIVAEGLDEIFPRESYRSSIIFYDNGYSLRRWREANPDAGWMGTRYIVDR
ncbi:unnamed protein product, partial [Ectocarpus sp. 4 AP-2014]